MSGRPPVSLIVPFHGGEDDAASLLAALAAIRLHDADEILVVDNTRHSVVTALPGSRATVVAAPDQQSSYYARNAGAERATNEWLLFIDSDCRPPAELIDAYFAAELDQWCGVVAGGVRGAEDQTSFVTSWARSRGHVGETYHADRSSMPAGITANLLVRRTAWEQVGGFHEGIRSGGDVEFCWRLQEVGWRFVHRPEASLEHVHVESLRALLRKGARYGAGRTWLERRYPDSAPRPRLWREVPKALAGALGFTLAGQSRRGTFKLVDGAWYAAVAWGHLFGDNRAQREPAPAPVLLLVADEFPTVEGRPAGLPPGAAVEAARRPRQVDRSQLGLAITYLEDDPPSERLRAFLWFALRHPRLTVRSRAGSVPGPRLVEAAPAARRWGRSGERSVSALGGASATRLAALIR